MDLVRAEGAVGPVVTSVLSHRTPCERHRLCSCAILVRLVSEILVPDSERSTIALRFR